jgi:hypothetical protein
MSITSGATAGTAAVAWGARVARVTLPPAAASGASEGTVGGHAEAATDVDEARAARCAASGWRLRVACTDGTSAATCPACGQWVGAFPDRHVGPGVWVIQEHGA